MALSASRGDSFVPFFLLVVMAAFAVFVEGILGSRCLSFCFGLMTLQAQLTACVSRFPSVVALDAIDLERLRMLLMGERYLSLRGIEFNHVLCREDPTHHQHGKDKACKQTYSQNTLLHLFFTPFLCGLE
jgi:hypothetical protein